MSAITRFLPKNHISYLVGWFVHLPFPKWLWSPFIRLFADAYKINLAEAELSYDQYSSLGEFFVRRLKVGARPVGESWIVHPADAVITQSQDLQAGSLGDVADRTLIQAKGKNYRLNDFVNDAKASEKYGAGFFMTYYLCPTDYHRVHSPVSGVIRKVIHVPGRLWPVNQWSTENIYDLFSVNERVIVEIETIKGLISVVFVGATNVGQIVLSFDSEIRGNQLVLERPLIKDKLNISIEKGQELGMFRMGSTVVLVMQQGLLSDIEKEKLCALKNQRSLVNASAI